MKSKRGRVQHIELNVSDLARSKAFYLSLLGRIGYALTMDEKDIVGWSNGETQIFIVQCDPRHTKPDFHRKRVGLNHVAFRASSRQEVDRLFGEFLKPGDIRVLYGGPKAYPEYSSTYYAVYFEDPDRIKLEFMHS